MKKNKNWLSGLINVAFYPCLAILLVMVVFFALGIRPYITMSGSMEPEILTGSVCFVNTRADYDTVQERDVIAFTVAGGAMVTHRVIAVTDEGLETKGDNNEVSDGISTTRANFRGKTLFSIPYLGYVLRFLQRPLVLVIIGICVLGLTALGIVEHSFSEKEADSHRNGTSPQ